MKIKKYFLVLFLAAAVACEQVNPDSDSDKTGGDEIENPGDDLLGGGEIDMTDWPDYTKPQMSTGPSVVEYSQHESTLNGRPFLPLGIYGVNQADMPEVAAYGFNLIQSYQVSLDWTEDQMLDWLDTAHENGLMTFVSLNGATLDDGKVKKIKNVVRTYKDHPAVYAWYLADEPYAASVSPADLIALYEWIKAEDPNHPVVSSNWELSTFTDACDVDMRQLYDGIPSAQTPKLQGYLGNSSSNPAIKTWAAIINSYASGWGDDGGDNLNPASMYSGLTEGTPEWAAAEEQAQFVIDNMKDPEAAGLRIGSSMPTTPELLRASLYWPLIHGSNGFYYWLYSDKDVLNKRWGYYTVFHYPKTEVAVKPVISEIAQLSKFLLNPGVASSTFTQDGLYIWSKIVDNRRLVIIANESIEDFEGDIDLSELYISGRTLEVYDKVTPENDGREVALSGNILSGETIASNETRVYFVI